MAPEISGWPLSGSGLHEGTLSSVLAMGFAVRVLWVPASLSPGSVTVLSSASQFFHHLNNQFLLLSFS